MLIAEATRLPHFFHILHSLHKPGEWVPPAVLNLSPGRNISAVSAESEENPQLYHTPLAAYSLPSKFHDIFQTSKLD